MKELVSFIAGRLVGNPKAVEVSEREENGTIIVELRVAKDDLGKIIGKQGRTAKAMRSILSAATEEGKRTRLEILD